MIYPEVHTLASANLRWRGAVVMMLPVRHNWPQLEMGGSKHTNATKASPQDAGIYHYTERHEGLTLFSGDPR